MALPKFITSLGLSDTEIGAFLERRALWQGCRFAGAVAADNAPNVSKPPVAFVINTQDGGDGHWEAAAFTGDHAFFFDSYGLGPGVATHLMDPSAPTNNTLRTFMREHAGKEGEGWTDCSIDLQSLGSTVCGEYSCLFLVEGPPSRQTPVWGKILSAGTSIRRDSIVRAWYLAVK